jgi:transcriptional regulator
MYVPPCFRPPDCSWATELIQRHPLALLVTNGPAADSPPYATHVPALLRDSQHVLGHMSRANPQWRALSAGTPVLMVFSGPHGYVSPAVYQVPVAVPTWNITAVQVRGLLYPVRDRAAALDVVMATVSALESRNGTNWDMSGSVEYFKQIVVGVGAFEVEVTSIEALRKLSQDEPEPVRERVRAAFAASQAGTHRELAALMGERA